MADDFLLSDGINYYCPIDKQSLLVDLPGFLSIETIQEGQNKLFDCVGWYKGCGVYLTYRTQEEES